MGKEIGPTHPSAAMSQCKGQAETPTVARLDVVPALTRTLRSTIAVESTIGAYLLNALGSAGSSSNMVAGYAGLMPQSAAVDTVDSPTPPLSCGHAEYSQIHWLSFGKSFSAPSRTSRPRRTQCRGTAQHDPGAAFDERAPAFWPANPRRTWPTAFRDRPLEQSLLLSAGLSRTVLFYLP